MEQRMKVEFDEANAWSASKFNGMKLQEADAINSFQCAP